MPLLEQNTTRTKQVVRNVIKLEFDTGNSEEYEMEAIKYNVLYIKELKDHLSGLHYLVTWKDYLKEENT